MAATPFFATALQRWVRACVSKQLRSCLLTQARTQRCRAVAKNGVAAITRQY